MSRTHLLESRSQHKGNAAMKAGCGQTTLLLLVPGALLVASMLACEVELLGSDTKCYYRGVGSFQIRIECATEQRTAPWKLCGQTKTLDDCEAWLRRQGIAA